MLHTRVRCVDLHDMSYNTFYKFEYTRKLKKNKVIRLVLSMYVRSVFKLSLTSRYYLDTRDTLDTCPDDEPL